MLLEPLDLAVFIGYCLLIIGMGLFVSREKKRTRKKLLRLLSGIQSTSLVGRGRLTDCL